jgi:hypothetical protein
MKKTKAIGYLLLIGGFLIGVTHFVEWFSRDGWTRIYTDQIVEVVKSTPPAEQENKVYLTLEEFRGKIMRRFRPDILGPMLMLIGGIMVGLGSTKKQDSSNNGVVPTR